MKDLLIKMIISVIPNISKKDLQVIYFHEVTEENGSGYNLIKLNKFKENMEYLFKNDYNTFTFEDLDKPNLNLCGKSILITFDDGYLNNYKLVYPIMKKYNLKFNIYLESGAIGKNANYLTWEMVNEMYKSQLVGFGAHTYNHVDARYITESSLEREIIDADNLIMKKTGINVEDFCFPYGMYDANIIKLLNELGSYKRLYTSDGRRTKEIGYTTLIGRVGIKNEDNIKTFIEKVKGKYNIFYSLNRSLKLRKKEYLDEVSR